MRDPYIINEALGGSLMISEDIWEHIQGYITEDALANSIPATMTIESLPECGVLVRRGSLLEQRPNYALYWTFANNVYSLELAVGDSVDLTNELV